MEFIFDMFVTGVVVFAVSGIALLISKTEAYDDWAFDKPFFQYNFQRILKVMLYVGIGFMAFLPVAVLFALALASSANASDGQGQGRWR